jgi:large subunit ribosomal protein L10
VRKAQKEELVTTLAETLDASEHVILTQYRGLTVKEIGELRRLVSQVGGSMRVIKNTLFGRALGEGERAGMKEFLRGPLAATFASADPVAILKAMNTFAGSHDVFAFRGGWIDGRLVDGEELLLLATLPPREELLARLLASMMGPLYQLVGVLQAVPRDLVLTLQAVAKERESAAPA